MQLSIVFTIMNFLFNISFSAVKRDGWKSYQVTTTLLITLKAFEYLSNFHKTIIFQAKLICFKTDFRYKQVSPSEPKTLCVQNVPQTLKVVFKPFLISTMYMLQTTKKLFESVNISSLLPLCILVNFEWLMF